MELEAQTQVNLSLMCSVDSLKLGPLHGLCLGQFLFFWKISSCRLWFEDVPHRISQFQMSSL